jgi:hypothetical protein
MKIIEKNTRNGRVDPTISHLLRGIALGLFALIITGCQLGPRVLSSGYPEYNQVIRNIEDEHMLMNLVRLRYLETPVFLQISSITSTYSMNVDASASIDDVTGGATTSGGVGTGYSETPTITYSLPETREFFGRVLAPLSASQLGVLALSGPGGILRMGVKKINRLENLNMYTGWQTETPATYAEFEEALTLIEELEKEGIIDFAIAIAFIKASSPFDRLDDTRAIPEGQQASMEFYKDENGKWVAYVGKKVPHLRFSSTSDQSPKAHRLRELLGLSEQQRSFPIVDGDFASTEKQRIVGGQVAAALDPAAKWKEVSLHNRSMGEVLMYASKSVQVPEEHVKAGLTINESDAMSGLLTIQSSKTMPENTAVRVQYKGYWYYIRDNDLKSKLTLVRLNIMLSATVGTVPGSQPVLSLPVR